MTNDKWSLSLYAARINRNLTRGEVCRETGISYERLGRFERGEDEPRASELQQLCLLYGVGIENLRFDKPKGSSGKSRRSKKNEK